MNEQSQAQQDAAAAKAAQRMGGSKVYGQRIYPKLGRYRWEIQAVKAHDGDSGLYSIAEVKIVRVEKIDDNDRFKISPNALGSIVNYSENVTDIRKGGGGRFLQLLLGLAGVPVEALYRHDASEDEQKAKKGEWAARFLGSKQPGAFLQVDVDVTAKPIDDPRPGGRLFFDRYLYTPVDVDDALFAQIDAKRKAAGLCSLDDALKSLLPTP